MLKTLWLRNSGRDRGDGSSLLHDGGVAEMASLGLNVWSFGSDRWVSSSILLRTCWGWDVHRNFPTETCLAERAERAGADRVVCLSVSLSRGFLLHGFLTQGGLRSVRLLTWGLVASRTSILRSWAEAFCELAV